MTTQAAWTKLSGSGDSASAGGLRDVVRQAVLDRLGRVHGYNLFFRSEPEDSDEQDVTVHAMIDNTMVFGTGLLANGLPVFVPCTARAIREHLVDVLPAGMTVLSLQEGASPEPELLAACRSLKSSGFRLALGSYCRNPIWQPLVELVDYIKVNFAGMDLAARDALRESLARFSGAKIAEGVETQEAYRQACAEGFGLFQGHYFCFPEMLKNRSVGANRTALIRILEMLNHPSMDLQEVARWVKRDTSLTYRLLRLVNSPVSAIRQEVVSIESALIVVGEATFRRIATLAIVTELNAHQPTEILRMGFVRARFCELAAECHALNSNEEYLLGMLSMLPAMLCVPMDELTPGLPLRDEIRAALHGTANRERSLLRCLEFHERGDWAACDTVVRMYGLEKNHLVRSCAEAVAWAEMVLNAVS